MPLSWIANLVFFLSYFVAWALKEIPHTTWLNVSAIAAIVIVALLIFDNRTVFADRRPAA
jgi:tetrahydromethanopterin S-methyltransferase subunit E